MIYNVYIWNPWHAEINSSVSSERASVIMYYASQKYNYIFIFIMYNNI